MKIQNSRQLCWSCIVTFLVLNLIILTPGFGNAAPSAHAQMKQDAWPTHYFAPYNFQPSTQTDLVALSRNTGTKFYTLAFIINSKGKTCDATWNAIQPIGSWMQSRIAALQGAGGDVSPSFGGAAGIEIADSCTTVKSLEAQYQSVVTAYHLTHLDFDIEGKTLSNTHGNDLRNKAIAALQQQATAHGQQLKISFTLPVNITGLPEKGIDLLKNAIQNGVKVSAVNIMTMDYYNKNAPGNQMGQNAIKAAMSFFKQLQLLYPSKSTSELWAMIGLTPMIGMNDDHKEIFTLRDAEMVLNFATAQNIALLSFWDVQRDHQCTNGKRPPNSCTGVKQQPYQYDQLFAYFTNV
ncbi:MAG: chitinase [Ktedonobacteraceae bacterium]